MRSGRTPEEFLADNPGLTWAGVMEILAYLQLEAGIQKPGADGKPRSMIQVVNELLEEGEEGG